MKLSGHEINSHLRQKLGSTRSRAEGDSRSAANRVRRRESRFSRHRTRSNPGGRFGVSDRPNRPKHPGRKFEARYTLYLCHPRLVSGYRLGTNIKGSSYF